ncbi:hypothetical protein LSAT2_027969 [Lamellibrachia satsuma]|nr:hypothetical protein LSAT2_027969 [Lamellibrachia satsuma]
MGSGSKGGNRLGGLSTPTVENNCSRKVEAFAAAALSVPSCQNHAGMPAYTRSQDLPMQVEDLTQKIPHAISRHHLRGFGDTRRAVTIRTERSMNTEDIHYTTTRQIAWR